jgi:glycosyltransferase involved in cell wall biosynthesis
MDDTVPADRRARGVNILHVIDALAIGGAERMLVEIANRTHHDGHGVAVCGTRAGGPMAARLHPAIEQKVLGRKHRLDARPLAELVRWTRQRKFDVVHCHGRSSFSMLALLAGLHVFSVPIVLHDHLGVEIHPEVPRWLPYAKRFLAEYVGVYDAHAAWARGAGLDPERVTVIANAIDMDATVDGAQLPAARGVRLVFIGGLRREKAVDLLLEALVLVDTQLTLFVIGGDADRAYAAAIRARASQPDLAGRVVFLGQREDAIALAKSADLAVHPARSESGPLVLAEYAALGVPFVATCVGGIAKSLADAGAGWFVDPDDARVLAAAIGEALANRARFVDGNRARARAMFHIASVMPKWYDVYARAMQRHR